MKNLIAAIAVATLSMSSAAFAACDVSTPVSLFGNDGAGNGLLSNSGGSFAAVPDDVMNAPGILGNGSVVGQIAGPGQDGGGVANLNGTADCSDDLQALKSELSSEIDKAQDESAALAAALATPSFLAENENFSVAGGIGFSDGEIAGGATAMFRVNRTVSAYAGGAVGSDQWAGKAGVRLGW